MRKIAYPIILASTSPYRRELLSRLQLPFTQEAPHVEEQRLPNEAPAGMAERLAMAKAQEVSQRFPEAVVIGSDQVAESDHAILGKPGTAEKAQQQLARLSGKTVHFHTALAVLAPSKELTRLVTTTVELRPLDANAIANYIAKDKPWDTAGSLKSESLGIALCKSIIAPDPTALIGLPLITLCELLEQCEITVLG